MTTNDSVELLKRLIAFRSVSLTPNIALIEFVQQLLAQAGIRSTLFREESGTRANLFATTGPAEVPGIVLSGHTDVVPVEGQAWSVSPFEATERDERIYGRGAADMKGFVACAVQAMLRAASRPLVRPLHLALSYDEEIGCVGVRSMLEALARTSFRPMLCIVGEPTMMQIATGHKGKAAYQAVCCGQEGHSSLAPSYLNAVHVAADFVRGIRAAQDDVARHGRQDAGFDVPYSTLHIGKIAGGKALNIVPAECLVDFEIRTVADESPDDLLTLGLEHARRLMAAEARDGRPRMELPMIRKVNAYPGLDGGVEPDLLDAVAASLPRGTPRIKVAYGSEGGLFQRHLNAPVVVCGPGSIERAHKPDEYVELSQMRECDQFLERLVAGLACR